MTSLQPKGAELQSSRIDFPGYFLMKRFSTHYLEHVGTFRMKYTLPPLVPRRSDCPGCFLSRLPIGTYEARFYTLCLFHFPTCAGPGQFHGFWLPLLIPDFHCHVGSMASNLGSSTVVSPTQILRHFRQLAVKPC